MWRSMFLATGIVLCILGAECLIMEKAVLAQTGVEVPQDTAAIFTARPAAAVPKEIKPPEWAPWSLITGGAVVILYSYSIPRRNG